MIEPEPVRLKERLDLLAGDERAELHAYASQGPSPELQEQMLAALEAHVGSSGASAKNAQATGWRAWQLFALAAALFAGFAFWSVTRELARTVAPPAPPVLRAAPMVERTPEPKAAASVPITRPETKPSPRRQPAGKAARSAVYQSSQGAADPLAELKLLARARRVLPSRAEAALALSEEHAQLYPHGTLAEEREVLAIEALRKLERGAEAERRMRAFLRAFPSSSQRQRLSAWLSEHADKP